MTWNFAVLWFQVQVVDQTNDANIDLVLMAKASGRPWLANSHNFSIKHIDFVENQNIDGNFRS